MSDRERSAALGKDRFRFSQGYSVAGDALPPSFQFSQSCLQDFIDCRRRFQLRYISRLDWPAVESEPFLQSERRMRQGAHFHHMIHQWLSGVPLGALSSFLDKDDNDDDLARWWMNYLEACGNLDRLSTLAGTNKVSGIHHEISLSAPLGDFRLVAKYDLILASAGGKFVIIDWKTSGKLPRRTWLADRIQTRLYPCILVEAGQALCEGREIRPEEISMVYWYADRPEQPIRFDYSADQFQDDRTYISDLVRGIVRLAADGFPKTDQESRCAYCKYRSLCGRGVGAGVMDEWDLEVEGLDSGDVFLEFEQVAEIEF